MSGISHNSSDGTGRLKISNSTSTHLSLGYTGSSQLDFNLPTNYGSSGQGLITDGTGGLSWGAVSGASGTNGTSGTSGVGSSGTSGQSGTSGTSSVGSSGTSGQSGTSGTSGQSGTSGTSGVGSSGTSGQSGTSGTSGQSGTSGTTPTSNTAYWFGETTHYQTLATGSSFIGLTVSNEINISGSTAAVFDYDGEYLIQYSINIARKSYIHANNQFIFLKYNGATVSSSINVSNPHQLLGSGLNRPPLSQPFANNTSFCIISATANSTLELFSYYDEILEIAGTQSGPAAKMSISKIA